MILTNNDKSTATLTIMRGLPGAGKSTHVGPLQEAGAIVASPDAYPNLYTTKEDGSIGYDVSLADLSHASSLRTAVEGLRNGSDVVVDATNLSVGEVAPYVALGQAFRANVVVLTINVDPRTAFERNTHGVPEGVFFGTEERPGGMVAAFESFEAPFHWQFLPWLSTRTVEA
jgi:predicted kinase